MKILFTIRDLHPGGACNLLLNVLPALQEEGNDIYLVYYNENEALLSDFKDSGINPIFIPYRGKTDLLSSVWMTYKLIRKKRIDLIHTNLLLDRSIAALAAWFAGIPCVSYIHHAESKQQTRYRSNIQKLLRKASEFLLSRLLNSYVAVSDAAAEQWTKQSQNKAEKVTVIHSGISERRVDESLDDPISSLKEKYDKILVSACRLDEIKGLDRLIRIFRKIVDELPRTGLIILGEGGFRSDLEQMIEALDLEDNVLMPGYKKNVYDYYSIADFYVNSSRSEALGISLLEAMQIGLPLLAANVGGNPEIIEDGKNGFLLDFNDEEAATTHMIESLKMADDEYQLLRKRTKKIFESRFTIERYLKQLLSFYRKILE